MVNLVDQLDAGYNFCRQPYKDNRWIFHKVSLLSRFAFASHLDQPVWMPETILAEDHPRTIPTLFDSNWPSILRQEDFHVHLPLGPMFILLILLWLSWLIGWYLCLILLWFFFHVKLPAWYPLDNQINLFKLCFSFDSILGYVN